jgi:poly(3-hydroxybutyrate) depolymerase
MAKLVSRSSALSILALLLWAAPGPGQDKQKALTGTIKERKWIVNGAAREALVYIPPHAKTRPSALVFAFHGGSGTMEDAAKAFAIHKHWTAAIVVYPQGLMTPAAGVLRGPGNVLAAPLIAAAGYLSFHTSWPVAASRQIATSLPSIRPKV